MLKKKKENDELKSFEVAVINFFIINFFKNEVESSSDAKVYTDDDDFEGDKVIRFIRNMCN